MDNHALKQEIRVLEKARDSVEKVRVAATAEANRLILENRELEKQIFRLKDNAKRWQLHIDDLLRQKEKLERELDDMTETLRGNKK